MAEDKDIIKEQEEALSMDEEITSSEELQPVANSKFNRLFGDSGSLRKLTGMYQNWFLDYASYVILERAVPHIDDGLKPVQRRILHTMKRHCAEGVRTKVQSIVGDVMKYHPHGDASIKDALVQLGQNNKKKQKQKKSASAALFI